MKKVILWSLIVAVLIVATTVLMIFIAKGYTFEDNQLVTTGIIDIDSDPDGAKIILDGKEVGSTPKQITRISQGEHQLELQKDGFTNWKKTLKIESGKVTTLSIKLIDTELNLVQITDTNVDQAFISEDAGLAIYTVTDNKFNTGLWRAKFNKSIFDFSDKDIEKIADINIIPAEYLADNKYSFEISRDNKSAILTLHSEPHHIYYVLTDLNLRYNSLPASLNDELGFNPTNIKWNDNSSSIILAEPDMYSVYDLKSKTTQLIQYKNDDNKIISSTNNEGFTIIYKNTITENDSTQTDNTKNIINFTLQNSKEKESLSFVISEKTSEPIVPQSIYLTNTDKTSFIFETIKGIYYINTQANFAKKVVDQGIILSVSPSGTGLLYELNDSTYSLDIEFNVVNNIVTSESYKIEKKSKESELKWYSYNDSIIEYDPNSKELSIFDIDGANRQLLLSNLVLRNPFNDFAVNNEKKEIIFNLEEEKTDSSNATASKNLYRLKL